MGQSKGELIARINARAAGRYGAPIDEVWLNDRIKDNLIDALDRGQNSGTAPKYFANACHYRRALQVKRLEAAGIKSRDALLVQLFIRQYGIPAAIVGPAVVAELRKALKRLRAQLTSNYFVRARNLGPKAEDIISKQLGKIDERFAHLELPLSVYFSFARSLFRHDFEGNTTLFSGFLASGFPLVMRAAKSKPDQLQFAAEMLFDINRILLRPLFGRAILSSPEIVVILLGIFLMLEEQKPTAEQLIASAGFPAEFEHLIKDFTKRVERFNSQE